MRSIDGAIGALACLALGACGGGGGGGGGGDGGSNTPPNFTLSANQLSFSAVENGPAPPPQTVTATATGGTFGSSGTVYLQRTLTGNAVASAEITDCSGSTCSVVVTVRDDLPPGSYSSSITISGCTNFQCVTPVGAPKSVAVSYVVASGPTLSSPASMTISAAAGALPIAQFLDLQSSDQTVQWTASVVYEEGSAGWLTVPADGTGSAAIAIQPDPLPAGHYRARVTFEPVGGGVGAGTLVLFSSIAAGVHFVTPYVAVAGEAGRVTIRGNGFAALGAPEVLFDATPGPNLEVVSDTEIRVDHPVLPAGRHPVTVGSGGQPMAGSPELVVVAPPAFPYARIDRADANPSGLLPGRLIYDAERQCIYLLEVNGSAIPERVERYCFSNGGWQDTAPLPFAPSPGGTLNPQTAIALTPDGRELVKTNLQSVTHYDAATGDPLATIDSRGALGDEVVLRGAAMTGDGGFVGPAYLGLTGPEESKAFRYDVKERAFYPLAPPASWDDAEWRIAVPTPSGCRCPRAGTCAVR